MTMATNITYQCLYRISPTSSRRAWSTGCYGAMSSWTRQPSCSKSSSGSQTETPFTLSTRQCCRQYLLCGTAMCLSDPRGARAECSLCPGMARQDTRTAVYTGTTSTCTHSIHAHTQMTALCMGIWNINRRPPCLLRSAGTETCSTHKIPATTIALINQHALALSSHGW